MRVALTGGSGVVGRALLRLLVSSGHEVRALVRSHRAAKRLAAMGSLPVTGDVLNPESLVDLVNGADWVFHVAGVNEICPLDQRRMFDVNVTGSLNVLEACKAHGVARMVHTSSAAALGESPGEVGSESTIHRGTYRSEYEKTKHRSEMLLLAERGELELVVVNPSSVQGPGRATGTGRLIIDVINGKLPFVIDTVFSVVDIDDCARGHILAAERGEPGSRYVLSGATLTIRQAIDEFARASGIAIHPRFIPMWLATAGAPVVEGAYRMMGRQPPLCREMARVLRAGASYDGSRAGRELGLVYRPIGETIKRAVEWYRAHDFLN